MIREPSRPLQTIGFWSLVIAGGILTACIGLIAFISFWEGFTQAHRSGSWVPILAGASIFLIAVYLYLRAVTAFYRHLSSEDLADL